MNLVLKFFMKASFFDFLKTSTRFSSRTIYIQKCSMSCLEAIKAATFHRYCLMGPVQSPRFRPMVSIFGRFNVITYDSAGTKSSFRMLLNVVVHT